jgi:hypothetical protein
VTRVTDEMVRVWLTWARNAGEVAGFRIGKGKARRFKVRVPAGVTCNGQPFRPKDGMFDILGHTAEDVVPGELMFTAREALAFGMGCATGRAAALAGQHHDWLTEDWTPEQRAAFEERREAAKAEHAAELDAERAEREAERQRRIADYKRRKAGTRQIGEAT